MIRPTVLAVIVLLAVLAALLTGCGVAHPVLHRQAVEAREQRAVDDFCSYGRAQAETSADALEIYVEQCE